MATTLLALAVYVLTVARLTRVITLDKIGEPARGWVTRRFGQGHMLTYLMFCTWCMSLWVAFLLAVPAAFVAGLPWWWAPGLALAASHVAGMAANLNND